MGGAWNFAKSDLESWKERSNWSGRMEKKTLMSKVQADADRDRVQSADINLKKVEEEKRVLTRYMKPRTITDLTAKVEEAKRNLERTILKAEADLVFKQADFKVKDAVYQQELARQQDIEGEIIKCTVRAPQDGLVVYYVPEQVRGGGGAQQSIVAQGEPVREGQKMMQIPDLTKMVVNVRVPEAFISHLHSSKPNDRSSWQHARVRVDAFPNRILNGHVKFVDTVASSADFFAADVKVYKTLVSIDDHVEGMKPGMSAEVTITAEESKEPVLVVPVQSVLGTITSGAQRKVWVIGPGGQPEERNIVVGKSNERVVEVKEGLKEGEKVAENPQSLEPEDSDMKAGKQRSIKGGDDSQGPGGKKGDGKKGGTPKTKVAMPPREAWVPNPANVPHQRQESRPA